jgi:hypothetical protein
MEKEMFSIVATLKEFCGMLLGADLHVFTNHKILTFDNLKTQCVFCWRNKVEEFSPKLNYIEGPHYGLEFLLVQTLSDFESKLVLPLPANKQHDGPTLFQLLEQCFQEVSLTECKNVVSARFPDKDTKTFENLVECQQDYLEALVGFPNIDDQVICWFHTT